MAAAHAGSMAENQPPPVNEPFGEPQVGDDTWIGEAWDYPLVVIDNATVTPGKLLVAFSVLILGFFISRLMSRHLGRKVLPKLQVDRGPASAIQTLVFYSMLVVVVFFSLTVAEVPLTVFTIFGGALALGIGFGSQNVVSNFISGLILLIERPVEAGDLVEVDGCLGVVDRVGARATRLFGYDAGSYLVPNSVLLESIVRNWNHANDLIRTVVPVGIAYGSDTAQARELLQQIATDHDEILDQPAPAVLFTDFGDNALGFEIHFFIEPKDILARKRIESDVRFAIDAAYRNAGIEIAFPQRDVHLDSVKPLEVRMLPSGERTGAE